MANKAIAPTFLVVLFLVASSEVAIVKGLLCVKPSSTFSGYCWFSGDCFDRCWRLEGASYGGDCQWSGLLQMCMCYYPAPCPWAQMQTDFIYTAEKPHQAPVAAPMPQLKN